MCFSVLCDPPPGPLRLTKACGPDNGSDLCLSESLRVVVLLSSVPCNEVSRRVREQIKASSRGLFEKRTSKTARGQAESLIESLLLSVCGFEHGLPFCRASNVCTALSLAL